MTPIEYVVDDPGWVQAARREHLERHVPGLALTLRVPAAFARRRRLWPPARRLPAYLASWRIALATDLDLELLMASVTSHYNIGGGLAPETAIPRGSDPVSVFADAVATLRRFRIVTANSRRLHDLLAEHVPGIVYAPNGVDHERFRPPPGGRSFDPSRVRVAWVGKLKAAKNFEAVQTARAALEPQGFSFEVVAHDKRRPGRMLSPDELRELFGRVDAYLCTSWHEGTPNPALEAAACGVPVITTRVGNMPELVRHGQNGFFIDPTAASAVEGLRALQHLTPDEHAALSRTIRADVERDWTWAAAARPYTEAFARLTAAGA